jgi:uncharacterized repeat protein (TIGR03803 family)
MGKQAPVHRASVHFTHVFSFNGKDGKEPNASLIDVSGTLYGTTYAGGTADDGTAFTITTSGKQSVLHNFAGGMDGVLPAASLLDFHGDFYGTTVNGGGPSDEGIAFKVTSSGAETVVHRFAGGSDGANPYAGLTEMSGTLYGTTAGGGSTSEGTIYTIAPASGKESVLYSFGSVHADGNNPVAALIDVKGTLYGTTAYGGANCGTLGCGTVFNITPSGKEKVLYSFKGGNDGSLPAEALIDVKGTLYGTTQMGGKANAGTVFKITTSGKESVVYTFQGGSDGAIPQGLVALNGTLYGTTSEGGSSDVGTIFALTTAGKETLLYTFEGRADGATPRAGLANVSGTLYGTTSVGGGRKVGTVFSIAP